MAYIEIESGPYLVKPTEEAFDNGERPVNVDQSNIVWLEATTMELITSNEKAANSAKVAFLWGQPQELYGTLVRLPAGFKGAIHSDGPSFRAVVVKGHAQYHVNEGDSKALEVGSSFSSQGTSTYNISNQNEEESMIYIRAKGTYKITAEN